MTHKACTRKMRKEIKGLPQAVEVRRRFLRKWAGVAAATLSRDERHTRREAHQRAGTKPRTTVGQCWSCSGWADLERHHVIQLQNGGTNWHVNIVRICRECHRHIHPWLSKPVEPTLHAPRLEPVPF